MNNELINKLKSNPMLAYAVRPAMATMTGYETKTTYYNDFLVCIEDEGAIRDTYKRALGLAKSDREYGTELAMVLNWLMWDFADYNDKIARVYSDLWKELDGYIIDNWKGADLEYYLKTTD